MSESFAWLTLLMLVPIVGALVVMLLPRTGQLARYVGLGASLVVLVLAVALAVSYDPGGGMQYTEQYEWIGAFGVWYALGVDGLGLSLVLLTAILVPVVLLASWHDGDAETARGGPTTFFALALVLEGLAIGVFAATDVFLFYVLFEATLIPAYFLIGMYGGDAAQRGRAAIKFLIYMLAGGLVMLASVVGLYAVSADAGSPTYLIGQLAQLELDTWTGRWLFLGFFIAFAIKAPLFPVHTWLADTTGSATPGVSVLLVCILDKIGTYGMLRFCLGLFPEASQWATPVVVALALISIVYGALLAIGSDDMLRLVGLTSLSHFGFIVLGIFVMNSQGTTGSILYMVNHGLGTAALFLTVGYVVHRTGTTRISELGGVEKAAPVLAGTFLIAGLSALGLPGLSTFVSEFLVLVGSFSYHWAVGAIAVTGIVLAAIYVLWMYQRVMTGPPVARAAGIRDLGGREVLAIAPLLAALVVFGFFPRPLLDIANPSTETTLQHVGVTDDPPTVEGPEQAGGQTGGAADEEAHQ